MNIQNFLAFFSSRDFLVISSTIFSLLVVLLSLNLITPIELASFFHLSPNATNALQQVFSRFQEVTHNIIEISGQLIKKFLHSAGIDNGTAIDSSAINNATGSAIAPHK